MIHPTAIVSKEAKLGPDVEVGPYCVIGPKVKIGAGTQIASHVVLDGDTQLGERCRIFSGVCIGGPAQAGLSKPLDSFVRIGDDNIFREYVTVNAAMKPGASTIVGSRNFLMANAHIGHDCVVGDDVTLANSAALGGHVTVGDRAVIGGLVGVHQYVRIGKLAMIGGVSKLTMDAVPFSIHDGRPTSFHGLNLVGLRRAGYKADAIIPIKKALRMLLHTRANMSRLLLEVEREFPDNADVKHILEFIRSSKRGVARRASSEKGDE